MFTTRPEIKGTFGVVSTTHWIAASVAMASLEKGGNAFDAATAAAFTLQVIEPNQNGLGGDVPIIFWSAKRKRVEVICGQGPAPAGATIAHYRSLGLELVPGAGLLAAVVPGVFDGWMLLLRDHGTQPLRDVLGPAIHYARHGYPVSQVMSDTIARVAELFTRAWPSSAAVYLERGKAPKPGSLFKNPGLADTYERILKEAEAAGGDRINEIEAARAAYYRGFVAEAIGRFCRTNEVLDSSGRRHKGVLAADDMARFEASYEAPLSYDYHGYRVAKTGPWGQGPVFLQQLALLAGFDLAAMGPESPEFLHTVIECAKLAFADREAWYGDPDFGEVPMAILLSEGYNAARRRLIGAEASLELRPGAAGARAPRLPSAVRGIPIVAQHAAAPAGTGEPGRLAAAGTGEPSLAGRGGVADDTVHVDVIDRWGNMVAAMPSGGWLQSSPLIPELGFCLGSRAQMFWLEEGFPASLAPGKRPRTTLSPGLVLREGEPYMAFGSPGGDGQDQWALHFFLRHLHHGLNLQEAIDQPAFQSFHWPDSFYPRESKPGEVALEASFPEATVEGLRARGHKVTLAPPWSLGRICACSKDGAFLKAGANPRNMQGYAIGR
ncbi:MAG TPA: gamma-glutamyltransferase family protein [Alphaproteobacteria bacterium]|nr:gamma-glutamyltransferase family protein [Alphaproteobacteria bacterium]